jgi:hypothetical protein
VGVRLVVGQVGDGRRRHREKASCNLSFGRRGIMGRRRRGRWDMLGISVGQSVGECRMGNEFDLGGRARGRRVGVVFEEDIALRG